MCFLFCNCKSSNVNIKPINLEKIKIAGYELIIENYKRKSLLKYRNRDSKGTLQLFPKPPCYFTRNYKGEPQYYSYQDVGVKAVIIIIGTPAKQDLACPITLKEDIYCGLETQGVLIKKDGIFLTERIGRGSIKSPQIGIYEKDFWLFAHPKK